MGEESLASQLAWLQSFGLFCVWCTWIKGQRSSLQQYRGPEQEDEGGDGVLRQGHRGEDLQEILLLDRGCRCRLWQFDKIREFSIHFSVTFFYFNKIGSFSAVLCPFLWNLLKFRKYRCHPVVALIQLLYTHIQIDNIRYGTTPLLPPLLVLCYSAFHFPLTYLETLLWRDAIPSTLAHPLPIPSPFQIPNTPGQLCASLRHRGPGFSWSGTGHV